MQGRAELLIEAVTSGNELTRESRRASLVVGGTPLFCIFSFVCMRVY